MGIHVQEKNLICERVGIVLTIRKGAVLSNGVAFYLFGICESVIDSGIYVTNDITGYLLDLSI